MTPTSKIHFIAGPKHGPLVCDFPRAYTPLKIPLVDRVISPTPPYYTLWECIPNHCIEHDIRHSAATLRPAKDSKFIEVGYGRSRGIPRRRLPSQNGTAFVFARNDDARDFVVYPREIVLNVQLPTERIFDQMQ